MGSVPYVNFQRRPDGLEWPKSGTVLAWVLLPGQEIFVDDIKNQYNFLVDYFMRQQMVLIGSCGKRSACQSSEASRWSGKA